MSSAGYRKLLVWRQADEFAFQVYRFSRNFPPDECFGITSQLRRAVVSIPTNIAEASGRQNNRETRQFLNVALGSLAETEYLLSFCRRLEYLNEESFKKLEGLRKSVGALLWRFYQSL